jgi:hypothetical protein
MRDVLISLKPYYYYLIGENIKKVEVRKSYPKADDWSRNSWFYMSRDEKSFAKIPKEFQEKYRKHFGKVGMRFVCDKIQEITYTQIYNFGRYKDVCEAETRLDFYTLDDYLKQKNGYGWHITDLVVYDEPRELGEFKRWVDRSKGQRYHEDMLYLQTPPQSWCYIEPRQTAD